MKKSRSKLKSKISRNLFPTLLLLFLFAGLLVFAYKYSLNKRYEPVLEKKLDMKTIPLDVKSELKKTPYSATIRIPVFMYHYVEYVKDQRDTIRKSLNITPATLENQIQTLKDAGFTFITVADLGSILDGGGDLPPNPVILTFDDGHRDFYTDVFPLLKKYNVKATAYIVPGFLGGSDFMEPDQVAEIADSGLVEIAAHTINHAYLKGKDLKTVEKEVSVSKIMLQDEFHVPVVSFAYPYGAFDQQAINAVKAAGYKTAVSTIFGIEVNQGNRFFIERIRPGGRVGAELINFIKTFKEPAQNAVKSTGY